MHHGSPASGDWLRFGGFQASPRRNELLHNGRPVEVGQRGMALLLALLRQAGTPVSKASLMEAGWGRRTVEPSNLTVQIASLRRQLACEPGAGAFIRTVPGLGYVFAGPVDSDQSRHRTEAGPGA
ncbi:MAG: winged helix-turn-helix domain-containing protein, partial [Janthinobacterium lividum]